MAAARMHRDDPTGAWLPLSLVVLLLGSALLYAQVQPGRVPWPEAASPMPPAVTSSEEVVNVQVVGHQSIPLRKIVPHIQTRAGRPLDMELIEEDVRRLNRTRMFVSIKPLTQKVPGGRVVIFEVVERPILHSVKYVGNKKIGKKVLAREAGVKRGDALDPFTVKEGRRKIEDFYHSRGYTRAHVTIFEGDELNDRGAVYVINEGKKQRILWTQFEGNTIATDARLRTQIQSKPGILWIFKGEVDRKQIDEDVNRLKAYYSSLGFLGARIGRELDYNESQEWLVLTFVIDEGPRYKVRDVRFIGNERFSTEELAEETELKADEFFNQAKLNAGVARMKEKYGGLGYVFVDVKPDIRYLERGQLDLVYEIHEGDRYRVGRIEVAIRGEDIHPHTKITTVLNRMSLVPGDIVDIRELRASERRLRASGLFLAEPRKGAMPKIVVSPPDLSDEDVGLARRPNRRSNGGPAEGPQGRGQSPDEGAHRGRPVRPLILTVQGDCDPSGDWQREEEMARARARAQQAPPDGYRLVPTGGARAPRRGLLPSAFTQPALASTGGPSGRPYVTARAQSDSYDANGGQAVPSLTPNWHPMRPSSETQPDTAVRQPAYGPANTNSYPPAGTSSYGSSGAGAGTTPLSGAPAYAPSGPPAYTAPGTAPAPGQGGGAYVPNGSVPARAAPRVGNPAPLPVQPSPRADEPFFPSGVVDDAPVFSAGPRAGEPLRSLPLQAITEEARTGRIMLGVGVNSDAGLVGSLVIDEQNFDLFRLPRGWEDIRNGSALRGAGQRLRLEAVPGTQVQRYVATFTEPYLLDTQVSLGLSGFFYNRIYNEWSEQRVGGNVRFGYQFRPDLTGSFTFRGEKVGVYDPILEPAVLQTTVPDLYDALGDNALYGFRLGLAHDTRDSAFLPTQGHLISAGFEQVTGTWQYPRGDIDIRKYFTLHQRADLSGRHVLSLAVNFGITGEDTPIYDHYFAGGFSTLRGFDFRGASPRVAGIAVGGHMQLLGSIQYMFPVTPDDVIRLVAFCDAGTVEREYDIHRDNFRVAPGFGLRIMIPAMGPAPLAFDFAFPVRQAEGDIEEVFSFFIGMGR